MNELIVQHDVVNDEIIVYDNDISDEVWIDRDIVWLLNDDDEVLEKNDMLVQMFVE